MAKSKGPSIQHFMHQTRRVGHYEHTHTNVPWIGRSCERRLIYNIHVQSFIALVWQKVKVLHSEILCTRRVEFIGLDAPVNEDRYTMFIFNLQYSLGMAKSEGPSIPNFLHQTVRVGHSEHTDTIIPWIGCSCERRLIYNIHIQYALK